MNRFIQTILIVFFVSSTAFSQERDSVVAAQDSIYKFEDIDSIYREMDPDLYAARKFAADSVLADSLLADSIAMAAPPKVKSSSRAL